jgi:hypothetical protein
MEVRCAAAPRQPTSILWLLARGAAKRPVLGDPTPLIRVNSSAGDVMKLAAAVLLLAASLASNSAFAQLSQDDVKWINECIADNKGGAGEAVIRKYCMCMNEKMENSETRSISQWEKANPRARAACDKESGWK